MNKSLLLETADVIETLEHGRNAGEYNMNYYVHPCGTPACTAGWLCHVANKGTPLPKLNVIIRQKATQAAGLTHPEHYELAQNLFAPQNAYASYTMDDPDHAAFVGPLRAAASLRNVAKHSEPCWHDIPTERELERQRTETAQAGPSQ